MPQSFYEMLAVSPDADPDTLRRAWQDALARNLGQQRSALGKGQDAGPFDATRALLEEAWTVLSDPARRARYDRYLTATASPGRPLPESAEALWKTVADATLDAPARASLELLGLLTGIRSGDPLEAPAGPRAERSAASVQIPSPRVQAEESLPELEITEVTDAEAAEPADRRLAPWRSEARPGAQEPRVEPVQDLQTLIMRHGFCGEFLRKVRESKGITLEQVAAQSRISLRFLEAIEADDHARLPATTFVRGYLREVARILGLDVDVVTQGYLANMTRSSG
jgi:hypothetical protein